jgi:hypothetical protein
MPHRDGALAAALEIAPEVFLMFARLPAIGRQTDVECHNVLAHTITVPISTLTPA